MPTSESVTGVRCGDASKRAGMYYTAMYRIVVFGRSKSAKRAQASEATAS